MALKNLFNKKEDKDKKEVSNIPVSALSNSELAILKKTLKHSIIQLRFGLHGAKRFRVIMIFEIGW